MKHTQHHLATNHYGGFTDIKTWNIVASLLSHRTAAQKWKDCISKRECQDLFDEFGVRWSELLRLPYFDPIRFIVVDPMHCLFLGISKWIVHTLWVGERVLTKNQLNTIQKRIDKIKLPPDIRPISHKIAMGENGFSNMTADQWKTFIMVYATPCMWDMLDNIDRQILGNFVRACTLLVSRIVQEPDLLESEQHLLTMSQLIEQKYGPEKIMSNIHLALHIPDIC